MYSKLFGSLRLLLIIVLIFVASVIFLVHSFTPHEQISWQADGWLHGRLDDTERTQDYVFYNGKFYWQLNPFPAVVMLPFRFFFHDNINQGIIQVFTIGLIAYLSFKLARLQGFNKTDSFYLSFALLFSSTVVGVLLNSYSWYFVQTIDLVIFLFFLYEFETKQRPIILGIYAALLLATRYTSAIVIFTLPFYFYFQTKRNLELFIKQASLFFMPVVASASLLGLYNYLRFDNVFETGTAVNRVGGDLASIRTYGVFSFSHIPSNLYFYFLSSVEPITKTTLHLTFPYIKHNGISLSLLLTSPFFLLAFRTIKSKEPKLLFYWITTLITFALLMVYYAPGLTQYGTRYALDFFPFIFILLLHSFKQKKLSPSLKNFILISATFNLYLLFTSY